MGFMIMFNFSYNPSTSTLPRLSMGKQTSTSTMGTANTTSSATLNSHQQGIAYMRDTLFAHGMSHVVIDRLLANNVQSMDALSRLTSLDYRRYGIELMDERTIRMALDSIHTPRANSFGANSLHRHQAHLTMPPPPRLPPAAPPVGNAVTLIQDARQADANSGFFV